MTKFAYAVVLLWTAFAGLQVLSTLGAAKSAPQEASGFALAVALAVIPYVGARAIEKMLAPNPTKPAKD